MSDKNELIPVTVFFTSDTIKHLKKMGNYLSIRDNQKISTEDIIKAAVSDYMDVMAPLSDDDVTTLKSLIFKTKNDQPYAIKNRFKEIMKQKGIKQVQIHRETEISESNLSQILNNKNLNMTIDSFLRIWLSLDCPPIADCLYREDLPT